MKRISAALAALLASSSLAAHADNKPKHVAPKIEVNLSTRAKREAKPAGQTAAAAAPLTADSVLAVEVLTTPVRAEQENILKKLIAATPDTDADEKADLYFRLGELYAKQQRTWRLKATEAEIKGDTKARDANAAKAQKLLASAVGAYKELTENSHFQNFGQMDLALFVYAYTLQSGKYLTQARSVYDKLLKNYPSSKYVPEAHLAFAEYYWDAGQLDDAEARYKKVLEFKTSNAYWYAYYKMGWIQLNKKRFEEALETFFQVAQATAKDPKRDVLYRNAKKDFVRAYAEIGKADKALVAFKRVDSTGSFDMLETLAGFYVEQGKSDKAIYTYRELMKLAPQHANVCNWQYEIAQATLTLGGATNADKVKEIGDLARLYTSVSTKKVLPASQLSECHDNAAAMSGELARAYHSEYAKTFSTDSYGAAAKLYATYLSTFPDADDAARTRYYQAELMWSRAEREKDVRLKTQLWEDAAGAYVDLVKGGKLEASLMQEAAYAAVRAYLYAHESDPRAKVPDATESAQETGKAPKPKDIPEREQKMLAAFDLYITHVKNPPEDELVQMQFLKANVLRRFDHLAEAMPIFKDIITKHPTVDAAEDAALLLLDSEIRLGDDKALLALTDEMLANKKLLDGKETLAKQLDRIKSIAERKYAENIEKKARATKNLQMLVDCGEAYLEIYNRNPENEKNDEVLYNAGVCFEDGRSLYAAIRMYQLLERFYPNSTHTAKAIARSGKVYADMAMYDLAAPKLEQYAKKYAGESNAFDAMSDAVFYYKGTGNDAKAIEDTKYFVRTFGPKKPAEAANAAFSLIAIYEKQGDTDGLIKQLREYIRVHGAKGGVAKLVVAESKLGQVLFDRSCSVKTVDGACVNVSRQRAVASRGRKSNRVSAQKTQCGEDSAIKLTVVARDARLVREAEDAFASAQKDFAKLSVDAPDYITARHFAAQAKLADATVALEAFYAVAFPSNLDFDPKQPAVAKKSLARFDKWFADKGAAGKHASEKLTAVLAMKDNASSIAAAAHIGQISQHFADALYSAEIPKNVRTGAYAEDKIEAYCDAVTDHGTPLTDNAVAAYNVCLSKSTELGWFSEWSQLCERELGQMQPDKFPTVSERRSDADRLAVVYVPAPPTDVD